MYVCGCRGKRKEKGIRVIAIGRFFLNSLHTCMYEKKLHVVVRGLTMIQVKIYDERKSP